MQYGAAHEIKKTIVLMDWFTWIQLENSIRVSMKYGHSLINSFKAGCI